MIKLYKKNKARKKNFQVEKSKGRAFMSAANPTTSYDISFLIRTYISNKRLVLF